MKPFLRPAEQGDIPALAKLEAAAVPFPWRESLYRDSLSAHCCRVLEAGGEPVGCLVYQRVADTAELLNIVVHPRWQGRGLGRLLLEHFIHENREHCRYLILEVRTGNERAIQLYRRLGFRETGRRKDYYPASEGREDALLYGYEYA